MSAFALVPAPLFLAGVFLAGLLVGSFLNVVIHRLPRRLEHDWRCQCKELLDLESNEEAPAPEGIVWGRSHCPGCGHTITAWENIPLLSWAMLRGRCSSCKSPISARYPLVELLTGLAFLGVAIVLGPGWACLAGLVLTSYLVALSGIDFDHQLLPDGLTLQLLWLGLALSLAGVFVGPREALLGAMAGYGSLWAVFQVFRLLTGKEGMGYGDFKLMAALGAWIGWQGLPLLILLSSLLGAAAGLSLMALRKQERNQPMPFGPYIALAGWITFLWGDALLARYFALSGLG